MSHKVCIACFENKPLSDFYGSQGDCKTCTKKRVRLREEKLKLNPDWVQKEKTRSREKYHRLGYKDKHKPSTEAKREIMKRYKDKYPEKIKAASYADSLPNKLGNNHHWSYNKEHWKDIIDVTPKNHMKAHRFLIYDQERMMYRRIDNNELLDTKEKHIEWIEWCLANKED